MRERTAFLVVIAIVLASAVALAQPITVGVLRGPTALAFAPLIQDGSSALSSPLDIQVFPAPDVLVARIISGDVNAATIPSNLAVQLYNRGVKLKVVGTFIWGVLYLVGPADPGSQPISELAGAEIYSPGRGATPDLVLRYLLERAGVAEEVAVRYGLSQVELAQLLISGRVERAVLPEPFVTRVLLASADLAVVADLQQEWRDATGQEIPQTVLVTVGEVPDDTGPYLLDMLSQSVSTLLAQPEESLATIGELGLGLDTETALAALPRLNLRVESGSQSRGALEAYYSVLEGFDPAAIGGSLPDREFYGD